MRLGSFCTGYGGLDMAVEAHYGAHLAWCSEVDKDCNQLLAHHWPGVPNLGDLTEIADPPRVDAITAGFPCQPFSHAGKRQGADDERAIFSYIADGISILRPGLVVLENVPGLLTLGGPRVVATLTGLGYDLRWGVVRASDAGAPHRRARWFCIARNTDDIGHKRGGPTRRRRPGSTNSGHAAADSEGAEWRIEEHETVDTATRSAAEPRERYCEAPTDTAALGPQSVRTERRLEEASGEPRRISRFGPYEPAVRRWERILGRPAPAPTDNRGLRPEFVEWMMGLPEGWVCDLGLSRTAELKMLGNGVVPAQAALALTVLDD